MWEFGISIDKNKKSIIEFVFKKMQEYVKTYDGVATMQEFPNKVSILIACNDYEKNRMILHLQELLSECICYHYKKNFLIKNLNIKIGDEMSKKAFITALLFFDKETDKYIVNKYLNIDKKIDIDGFFNFKLQSLKNKWKELIEIANKNDIYLYSYETFLELVKFLVDNIETKSDVINIMSSDDTYDIYDFKFQKIENIENYDNKAENLLGALIALCPKNINIYCSEILPNNLKDLICKLFEKRVRFISKATLN